jgi:hypothetical protein
LDPLLIPISSTPTNFARYETPVPLPLPVTFPPILSNSPAAISNVLAYPTLATLSTSTSIVPFIRSLASTVKNSVIPRLAGIEWEDVINGQEREALTDSLTELAECYIEGFESDENND